MLAPADRIDPKFRHSPLFQNKSANTSFIQPKINIGKPGDKYEVEADAMADKVVNNTVSQGAVQKKENTEEEVQQKPLAASIKPLLQRQPEASEEENVQAKCADCEQEEKVQRMEEEEGEVQTKSQGQNLAPSNIESSLRSSKGSGSSLSGALKNEMESGFGADFSQVNIHTNSNAIQMNKQINAHAFTHGNDIYFNEGRYNPSSAQGKHLLAHELTHTIQQSKNIKRKGATIDNNLQSSLLAGNLTLENCLDGIRSSYLRYGSRKNAVKLVQLALVDLGFLLPRFGVDGIFLNETLTAVRQFQKSKHLQVDGIIGTLTIDQIDRSHSTLNKQRPEKKLPIPDVPTPGSKSSCSVKSNKDNSLLENLNISAPPTIQAKHLSINDSVSTFIDKIKADVVKKNDPKVSETGQFYWSGVISERIRQVVDANVTSFLDPLANDFGALLSAAVLKDKRPMIKIIKDIKKKLTTSSASVAKNLGNLLKPSKTGITPVGLWRKFDKINKVPQVVDKMINIHDYHRIRNKEKDACFDVAQFMINRFNKRGGHSKIDPDKKRSSKNKISLTTLSTSGRRHFNWVGNRTKGDVLTYGKKLGGNITKMKQALDDGFLIHARVMSGTNFGTGLNPAIKKAKTNNKSRKPGFVKGGPEHSLVIVGYDNNEFVFWDPDSSVSERSGKKGFGSLFFQSGRLTTAERETDLFVRQDGSHFSNGNKRYQVIAIFS